jgi:hypothetical protein
MMTLPQVLDAEKLETDEKRRLFIGAYGFEKRSFGGWVNYQNKGVLSYALVFKYEHPKGRNRIKELRMALKRLGVALPVNVCYDTIAPHNIEDKIYAKLIELLSKTDEVILDISGMTKLLILICICKLEEFHGTVRIVYSEPNNYPPTKEDYEKNKGKMEILAKYPSSGSESIIRTRCLSSIRMQGQPVTLIAFTSFNEQLIRHMLGTISPHRLILINGRPPREEYSWREHATQEIHKKLIMEDYQADNPLDKTGKLVHVTSTLEYSETINKINAIYKQFGMHERIMCIATGSKMQTVGLAFSKIAHPDIHVEYPTPDSYYEKGLDAEVRKVYEIKTPYFSKFLEELKNVQEKVLQIDTDKYQDVV